MSKKKLPQIELIVDKIVGGGQALGVAENGKKTFVWGALPGEKVRVQVTKKKSAFLEAVAMELLENKSKYRVEARDTDLYLSTSPWQIMDYEYELEQKENLIAEAFELSGVKLPKKVKIETDGNEWGYRNKMEYSFWGDDDGLHLAFYRRGTHGKIIATSESLARIEITELAKSLLSVLNAAKIEARQLKTLLVRCNADGDLAAQIYCKDAEIKEKLQPFLNDLMNQIEDLTYGETIVNIELIYSNPQSPASVITEKLWSLSDQVLHDKILKTDFSYATEGFFQINLPVYEMALQKMAEFVDDKKRTVDMYSGVGTIGLTIGRQPILVEINEHAVREMRENVQTLAINAQPVLASAETALDYITNDIDLIVDPPRAGLHDNVVQKILDAKPHRVIYLSCNPVTQARDIAKLLEKYEIIEHIGYNFFPKTPHIENLVILQLK